MIQDANPGGLNPDGSDELRKELKKQTFKYELLQFTGAALAYTIYGTITLFFARLAWEVSQLPFELLGW
jgi:hypothetical protein